MKKNLISELTKDETGKLHGGFSVSKLISSFTEDGNDNTNCLNTGNGDSNTNCSGTCWGCSIPSHRTSYQLKT